MKVRTAEGGCYYLDDEPDEHGEYSGINKYTDTRARLRWHDDTQTWEVTWEAELRVEDYL